MPTQAERADATRTTLLATARKLFAAKGYAATSVESRVEGDIDNGGKVYQKLCASCHGKQGQGKGMFPMIVGQYSNYLKKQLDAFLRAERPHDEDSAKEGILYGLKPQDLQDILAYLTTLQNQE